MDSTCIEFIVKGLGSDISTDLYEPLHIKDGYEAKLGIKSFSTYNNVPNVESGRNNSLKIKVPGEDFRLFTLETGAYELPLIERQIQNWIAVSFPELKKVEETFRLFGNEATSKAEFVFKEGFGIDFNVPNSIHHLLGFGKDQKFEGIGRYVAPDIINIVKVTQLVFNCSLIECNYINGREVPFLFNCGIDVPAGFRLSRELSDVTYKKLTATQISHIRIWIVDQDGDSVNLRKDELTVTLSLKVRPRASTI